MMTKRCIQVSFVTLMVLLGFQSQSFASEVKVLFLGYESELSLVEAVQADILGTDAL